MCAKFNELFDDDGDADERERQKQQEQQERHEQIMGAVFDKLFSFDDVDGDDAQPQTQREQEQQRQRLPVTKEPPTTTTSAVPTASLAGRAAASASPPLHGDESVSPPVLPPAAPPAHRCTEMSPYISVHRSHKKNYKRLWSAMQDAELETEATYRLRPAVQICGVGTEVLQDISKEVLVERIGVYCALALRMAETLPDRGEGARVYIGSTSSPKWRWEGGTFWRSEANQSQPNDEPAFMDGHRLSYQRMYVLGAWPDAVCAEMEKVAIATGEAALGILLQKAQGCQGLRDSSIWVFLCVFMRAVQMK